MFMFILATASLLTLFVERIFGGKKCISIDQSCFTKLAKGCVICQPMVALNQKLIVSSVLDTSTTVSWFLVHFRLLRFSFWTLFPGRLLQTLVLVNSSVMLISFSFSVMGIVITFPLAILKRKALASLCIDCNNKR